jgi:hypothetical protein
MLSRYFNKLSVGATLNLFKVTSILFFLSCNNINSKNHLANSGKVAVLNGKNELDSLSYNCDSCSEILRDKSVFDTIVSLATQEAKSSLKNKLSFKPMSVDFTIFRRDSLFYSSGEKIDSLTIVLVKYKCIGKNGYGVEDEVETSSIIYLINNKVKNIEEKIKKEPLTFKDGVANRTLMLFDENDFIKLQPVSSNGAIHIIGSTNETCVEDTRLSIDFIDSDKISIKSWNDFNCKSNSYFRLSSKQLEKLGSVPIRYISFSGDEFVFTSVPENERDYFIQFVKLLNLKK